MKLLVLGATGATGRHVVDLAVRSGDEVTAFVRNPAGLGDLADRVTVVSGDATSEENVSAAMPGHDAIISALGAGRGVIANELFTRSTAAVLGGAEHTGVSRLVWLSSFGVGDTYASASFSQKLMYRTFLRSIYADKQLSEQRIRSSGLDWTLVYPTRLTNGAAKGTFRVGDRLPMKGNPAISRADVAAFMVQAAHGSEWIRRDAVITD